MKNADMPAMPMGKSARGSYWTAGDLGDGYAEQCKPAFGLTKREMFAMHCIAQLLPSLRSHSPRECAKLAIEFADALLAELEVENGR